MSPRGLLRAVIVTVLVLATSGTSAPRKSSQDQYEQRDDQAQTETNEQKPLLHSLQLSSTGLHRFGLVPEVQDSVRKPDNQDLQVGCGEGSVQVQPEKEVEIQVIKNNRNKRELQNRRIKRNFIRWQTSTNLDPYAVQPSFQGVQSQSSWNAFRQPYQPYQIFIPIWGNPRGVPIFFPPKPILLNPGYPLNNRPVIGPENPTSTSDSGTNIGSRFGDPNRNEGVAWGFVDDDDVRGGGAFSTVRPTARPNARPTTRSPSTNDRPNLRPNRPIGEIPPLDQNSNDLLTTTRSPITTTTPETTTQRQLNRCVWAIVSCCNPGNDQIRYSCFENLGCPGAFWDNSPCSREVTQAAFNAAQEFYDQIDR